MVNSQTIVQGHLGCAVLEHLPTPTVVLDDTDIVVVANRACQQLVANCEELISKHVSDLPLTWQDGSGEALQNLLTRSGSASFASCDADDAMPETLRLRVDICQNPQNTVVSSDLLASIFTFDGCRYRVLSFENITENHVAFMQPRSGPGQKQEVSDSASLLESIKPQIERRYAGTIGSTVTSQEQLDAKFAQLRDAIFFNEHERTGFLLSADETFCFPNVQGTKDVIPVEIDDKEAFFESWDAWDATFTSKLPISELPILWLNKHRTPFVKRRMGLIQAGNRNVLEVTGEPIYDHPSGEYIGGVVWSKTLGEYEIVLAQDLKADLADFRAICDRLPHLLWTMDATGHADYFSQSWYEFTGLTEEQSLGIAFEQAIHKEDMPKVWAAFVAAGNSKTEYLTEARYRRYDGRWFWMSIRAKSLCDRNGNILKWYGSSTNIDSIIVERLVAERQKTQMMEMLSLANVGLFEVSPDWQMMMLEGRMDWLDQEQAVEIISKLQEMHDKGALSLRSHMQKVMAGEEENAVFEEKIGDRWYKFRLVMDAEPGNLLVNSRKVLGCSIDVTEQRIRTALESENARLTHEALFEMEKSRMKTAFLAHMSHEIRTPIAGIIGTASALTESELDDDQVDSVNDIQTLGENLLTIVNDILDFSKIEAGKMDLENAPFDINSVVSQVKKVFRHIIRGKPLEIICQQDFSLPLPMVGDAGRIKQILVNLVSNAVKFTTTGSIELAVTETIDQVRITVQDTGEGINKETMSTLFQPFVQGDASTARKHGGTGLGLTISRDLAQKMGGALSLDSVASKGTTATLMLPRGAYQTTMRQTDIPIISPMDQDVADEISATKTNADSLILIVEDNAINRKIAVNLVRKLGYRAAAACNGQEALDYIETHEPPSLILMDCQMPLLDGYEAARQLRSNARYEKSQTVPIVALTASAVQGDQEKCYAAGMDAYLSKPVTRASLQSTITRCFTGRGDRQEQ